MCFWSRHLTFSPYFQNKIMKDTMGKENVGATPLSYTVLLVTSKRKRHHNLLPYMFIFLFSPEEVTLWSSLSKWINLVPGCLEQKHECIVWAKNYFLVYFFKGCWLRYKIPRQSRWERGWLTVSTKELARWLVFRRMKPIKHVSKRCHLNRAHKFPITEN